MTRLTEVIEDAGFSGKNLRRPGLQRALTMLESGEADALLVAKLDRLTRSVRDLGALIAKYFEDGRFSLMSVGEQIDTRSAGGRLVLNVLASVSQWEREKISEPISEAMALKAKRGEYLGGEAPFGWDVGPDGKHLVENLKEQRTIVFIQTERASGSSLRKISERLYADDQRPRRGKRFHPTTISRILKAKTAQCRDADAHQPPIAPRR